MPTYTLNVGGRLLDLSTPQVMGILNLTPDSFYADSRVQTADAIRQRTEQIIAEGASVIDVGAYSSRPQSTDITAAEEMQRLRNGLSVVRAAAPDAILSVDTFRSDVARMCVEEYGVHIVNDISGGSLDPAMLPTVARLGVPYVLMHMQGTPQTMQQHTHYDDLVADMLLYFAERIQRLRDCGQKDIILDPGFGFAKTTEQNYDLLARLDTFHLFGLPLLVWLSRKSMIYQPLGATPQTALNGTTAAHAFALERGCHLLRVHDVRAAVEAVRIHQMLKPKTQDHHD